MPRIIEVCGEALFLAPLFVDFSPLRVFGVLSLIVCCVHVVNTSRETGIHNGQVLIWQGKIEHNIRFHFLDKGNEFIHLVGVHLGSSDDRLCLAFEFSFHSLALAESAAGNADFAEHFIILGAFSDGHTCDTAASDNQYF